MPNLKLDEHRYFEICNFLELQIYGYELYYPNKAILDTIGNDKLLEIYFKIKIYAKKFYTKIACIPKNLDENTLLMNFASQCHLYVLPAEIRHSTMLSVELIEANFSLDVLLGRAITHRKGYDAINNMFNR